jgi:hypothetical protein
VLTPTKIEPQSEPPAVAGGLGVDTRPLPQAVLTIDTLLPRYRTVFQKGRDEWQNIARLTVIAQPTRIAIA